MPLIPGKVPKLKVTLDAHEDPENVGVLLAERLGYFADVGQNVFPASPATPLRPVSYVVDGTDEFGISQEPQVVLAKAKGAPIVVLGSLVSQPTAALIWTKRSRIAGIGDLKGKTIAIPGLPFQKALLRSVLARDGLTLGDVKVVTVGYDLAPALISGRADATFGGSGNVEGPALEARGVTPVVGPVRNLGVPAYDELVLIARSDLVAKEPEMVRAFMSAVARGNALAVADPKEIVQALETSINPFPHWGQGIKAAAVDTAPLLSESTKVDPHRLARLVDWMYEEGMIQRKPSISALLADTAS